MISNGQISFIIFVVAFVTMGTAAVMWNIYTPQGRIKTTEEKRADSYYDCVKKKVDGYMVGDVRTFGVISDCDAIK